MENRSQQTSKTPCENCFQLFTAQKIDLHQAYCKRNIKKCNVCHNLYDINDQDAHEKQFHSKKQCRHCRLSFPQKQFQIHQPLCKRRPLKCQYCQNDIAYQQFIKHQEACGSRTTKCTNCSKFISLKQIQIHKLSCIQRLSPVRYQRPPPRSNSRNQLRQNIRQNMLAPMRRQYLLQRQQRRHEWQNIRQTNTREHRPSYQGQIGRNDRISDQRLNVVSNERPKKYQEKKPSIKVNFQAQLKPSHIIQPQKIRQAVDPVPISIRLAMNKSIKKVPLQNKN